jgi:Holliday junction resolvase
MRTPEAKEKDKICKYLDSIGAWYFRAFMSGYGKSGIPDIVACISGVLWGLEVKREGKGPTERQKLRMKEIQKSGGMAAAGTALVLIAAIEKWYGKS